MMNNDVVAAETERLAGSLVGKPDILDHERVSIAYKTVYGRLPTDSDIQAAIDYTTEMENLLKSFKPENDLRLLAWQSFLQAMFTANEFIYVD